MVKKLACLTTYLLVVLLIGDSAYVVHRYSRGDRLLSVQTGSMRPVFGPGDAVLTHKTALQDLQAGDIVSYRSPADNRVVVSHRVTSINYQTGRLTTKGDALTVQDIPFPSNLVIGRAYEVVPYAGTILGWLHTPSGLLIAVYIPAIIILSYEAKRFSKRYVKPHYHLYGYR